MADMDPASPFGWLTPLADALPADWLEAAVAGRLNNLSTAEAQLLSQLRAQETASLALRLAHLWLVAGQPERGDALVMAVHQEHPNAGLIPNWWGFWEQPTPTQEEPAGDLHHLGKTYLQLRHTPVLSCWGLWFETVRQDLEQAAAPEQRLLLGWIIQNRRWLPAALEPALEQLLGEAFVAAHPAQACRLFNELSERLPQWSYARLKAADLCLDRGELERCGHHLSTALDNQWQLAWLHDIAARLAIAKGDVLQALEHWQQAVDRCHHAGGDQAEQASMQEIFRQRAREARRGPGVLQARSLINRNQQAQARSQLEFLLNQDPQWQPLRSLLEQCSSSSDSKVSSNFKAHVGSVHVAHVGI